jgi:mannose-6-phosphate isomerase-like protein (cupin superfamily)
MSALPRAEIHAMMVQINKEFSMDIHRHEQELAINPQTGLRGGLLIDASHGAIKGFCMGITYYTATDYGTPGVHDDQEGFYIIEGSGTAKVGSQEFRITPGSSFIAAKGVPHTMKKDPASPPVKALWCHGAV